METPMAQPAKEFKLFPFLKLEKGLKFQCPTFKISKLGGGLSCKKDGAKTLERNQELNDWRTALLDLEFQADSVHYLHVVINSHDGAKNIMIGICNEDFDFTGSSYPGSDNNSFGYYYSDGKKYTCANSKVFSKTGSGDGDEIGMLVNMVDRTLSFFLNGDNLGTAFKIPEGKKKWFPAVGIYTKGSVTICDVEKQR